MGLGPLAYEVALLGVQALTGQLPGVQLFASSSFLLLAMLFGRDQQTLLTISSSSVAFYPAKNLLISVISSGCLVGPVPQRPHLSSVGSQGLQDQKG